jgi:hypothetical protein
MLLFSREFEPRGAGPAGFNSVVARGNTAYFKVSELKSAGFPEDEKIPGDRMKKNPFPILHVLAVVLTLAGCAASLPYQKAETQDGNGYTDQALDRPGCFAVDYMAEGKDKTFARYAAYYRAAELAYETGYRYFIPLKEYDITKTGRAWVANRPSFVLPGVRVIIQCYLKKPSQPSYDAYQYLNTAKTPGSPVPYSVAQRKGDQAASSGTLQR